MMAQQIHRFLMRLSNTDN